VNTVMNLRVPWILGNSLVAERLAASPEGLSCIKFVSWFTQSVLGIGWFSFSSILHEAEIEIYV
jgi:hypothetical protein